MCVYRRDEFNFMDPGRRSKLNRDSPIGIPIGEFIDEEGTC